MENFFNLLGLYLGTSSGFCLPLLFVFQRDVLLYIPTRDGEILLVPPLRGLCLRPRVAFRLAIAWQCPRDRYRATTRRPLDRACDETVPRHLAGPQKWRVPCANDPSRWVVAWATRMTCCQPFPMLTSFLVENNPTFPTTCKCQLQTRMDRRIATRVDD